MRLLALAVVSSLAACSSGSDHASKSGAQASPSAPASGTGNSRSFAVTDFTGVELRGSDDVDVRVGSGFSVRAEGPSEELDKLVIHRDGDTLEIGRASGNGFNWSGGKNGKVTIYVTMPRIAEANVAGSGNLAIDRVEGQKFDAEADGSGNLSIATLAVESAKFEIAGSGNIKAAGSAKRLSAEIAGSGDIDASGLTAEGADVSVAGSGNVRALVNGPASVSLVGSGDIDLGRGAKCTVSKTGSGNVRCS